MSYAATACLPKLPGLIVYAMSFCQITWEENKSRIMTKSNCLCYMQNVIFNCRMHSVNSYNHSNFYL